jgi:hypothetical protein
VLKMYEENWGTIRLVRDITKGRRKRAYEAKLLVPKQKYGYLKDNSAKREPTASRTKHAKHYPTAGQKRKRGGEDNGSKKRAKTAVTREDDEEFVEGSSRDGRPADGPASE